jgi:hypothetical protein
MKFSNAIAVGLTSLLAHGVSLAQNGNMMNGGDWMGGYGGYGGSWGPILLVVVVGVVVWAILQKRK